MIKINAHFKNKDIISLDQFDIKSLQLLFKTTDKIIKSISKKKKLNLLANKIITLLFYEPSSRTFGSFSSAIKRLGGQTIDYQNPFSTSSAAKGETIEDTMCMFSNYSDAIVIRHPQVGTVQKAADATSTPIINAGDGIGEHPTQALQDIYTLYERFGKLNNLKGLISGDLLNGRTVHSLIKALSFYKNIYLYLLSPKELRLSKDLFNEFENRGVKMIEISSEKDIPLDCNFWYWTRVQKERFKNIKDYGRVKNKFIITPKLLKEKGNKNMLIMHPLPRVGEIDVAVDKDPRSVYLTRQAINGVYIRMALLSLILK